MSTLPKLVYGYHSCLINLSRKMLKAWLDIVLILRPNNYCFQRFLKCLSTSTCLVISCRIGLWAILHAVLLSQYNFIGLVCLMCSSCIIFLIHNNSYIALVILLYSALADNLATTSCFLLLQVTKLLPINVKYLDIDRRLSIDLAQSASV
jgi:hypothetical protein